MSGANERAMPAMTPGHRPWNRFCRVRVFQLGGHATPIVAEFHPGTGRHGDTSLGAAE